jgi:hypothetical protein
MLKELGDRNMPDIFRMLGKRGTNHTQIEEAIRRKSKATRVWNWLTWVTSCGVPQGGRDLSRIVTFPLLRYKTHTCKQTGN